MLVHQSNSFENFSPTANTEGGRTKGHMSGQSVQCHVTKSNLVLKFKVLLELLCLGKAHCGFASMWSSRYTDLMNA